MTAPGTDVGLLNEISAAITNVAVPHHEPPAVLRRRIVVVIVLVIGTGAAWLFAVADAGETSFYWLTFALAAVWTVGTFASGPLHLGSIYWRGRNQRPVISGGGMVAAPDPR